MTLELYLTWKYYKYYDSRAVIYDHRALIRLSIGSWANFHQTNWQYAESFECGKWIASHCIVIVPSERMPNKMRTCGKWLLEQTHDREVTSSIPGRKFSHLFVVKSLKRRWKSTKDSPNYIFFTNLQQKCFYWICSSSRVEISDVQLLRDVSPMFMLHEWLNDVSASTLDCN